MCAMHVQMRFIVVSTWMAQSRVFGVETHSALWQLAVGTPFDEYANKSVGERTTSRLLGYPPNNRCSLAGLLGPGMGPASNLQAQGIASGVLHETAVEQECSALKSHKAPVKPTNLTPNRQCPTSITLTQVMKKSILTNMEGSGLTEVGAPVAEIVANSGMEQEQGCCRGCWCT